MRDVTNPVSPVFLSYVGCFFPPWLYVILIYFLHDEFNWSSPSFSSTTYQYFPGISALFSSVKFQHRTELCSKCITLLVSCLSSSPVCWWKESSSFCWMLLFFCGNPGFNFTCTSCIICYHTTKIFEIFHILQLYLFHHNLYWGWLAWDSHYLSFFHIYFHRMISSIFSLSVMPSVEWCVW